MKYSNKEVVIRIDEAKKNYSKLAHITDKTGLSTEDKMKISLCKHFVQFKNEKRLALKDMSELTGIPSSRLSDIVNYKIKLFTLDKLIHNLAILGNYDIRIKAYLEYASQVFEVPNLQVGPTKKLTKSIKDVAVKGSDSTFLNY